jgi:hypothetical protein
MTSVFDIKFRTAILSTWDAVASGEKIVFLVRFRELRTNRWSASEPNGENGSGGRRSHLPELRPFLKPP